MKKLISVILMLLILVSAAPAMYAVEALALLDTDALDTLRQANPDYDLQISPDGAVTFELIAGEDNYFSFPANVLRLTTWTDYYAFMCTVTGLNEALSIFLYTPRDSSTLYKTNTGTAACKAILPENQILITDIAEIGFYFDAPQTAHTVTISGMMLDVDRTLKAYTHESALCLSPTGIGIIDSAEDLKGLSADIRPAVALFYPDTGISLQEATAACAERIIPAFYVTEDTIDGVLAHLVQNTDAFIVADSAELLQKAYAACPDIGRVLRVDAGEMPPAQIHQTMNTAMARTVLIANEYADKDTVRYLTARMDAVWVCAENKTEIYCAITSGAAGVVTSDVRELYTVYDTFTAENSLMNPSFIVGHRGIPVLLPENTTEGALLAVQKGATHVECDIFITTDGHIVISHDANTGRCGDKDIVIEASTLEQIKEVTLEQGLKIPELTEFLTALKPTGALVIIEIKSGKTAAVDETVRIIRELNMTDQCVFISFNANQISYLARTYPELACGGWLGSTPAGSTSSVSSSLARKVRPLNCTVDLSSGGITTGLMQDFLHRGLTTWGWTIDNYTQLYQFYTGGMTGITTNTADTFSDFFCDISEPDDRFCLIKNGQAIGPMVTLKTYVGGEVRMQSQILMTDGAAAAIPGMADVCLYAGTDYKLYTQPITLTFLMYGDLTEDGHTSLADVIALARLVMTEPDLDAKTKKIADADENGAVSLTDITTLARYILEVG